MHCRLLLGSPVSDWDDRISRWDPSK
jgi:hypothetical protein